MVSNKVTEIRASPLGSPPAQRKTGLSETGGLLFMLNNIVARGYLSTPSEFANARYLDEVIRGQIEAIRRMNGIAVEKRE